MKQKSITSAKKIFKPKGEHAKNPKTPPQISRNSRRTGGGKVKFHVGVRDRLPRSFCSRGLSLTYTWLGQPLGQGSRCLRIRSLSDCQLLLPSATIPLMGSVYGPLSFTRSNGTNASSGSSNQGVNVNYWSATSHSTNAYRLNSNSGRLYPGTNTNNRGNANTVRCMSPAP